MDCQWFIKTPQRREIFSVSTSTGNSYSGSAQRFLALCAEMAMGELEMFNDLQASILISYFAVVALFRQCMK